MNYKMTAILKILVHQTYDLQTRKNCFDKMTTEFGLSETSNRIKSRLNQEDILFNNALQMFDFLGYEVCAQHDNTLIPLTSTESAITAIKVILVQTKLSKVELAKRLKVTYVALMQFFKQVNVKSRTLVKTFNALDYWVVVKPKEGNGKTYIVGDEGFETYQVGKMYDEAVEMASSDKPIGHLDFFDSFLKECTIRDWQGVVYIDELYERFRDYWFSRPEIHPVRSYGDRSDIIGKNNFRILLSSKFGIDKARCYGIKIKEA